MDLLTIDDGTAEFYAQVFAESKERGQKEETSVNTVMLKILKESLGMEKKKRRILHDDLDHLAGSWNAQDEAEFYQAVAPFQGVDEGMWK